LVQFAQPWQADRHQRGRDRPLPRRAGRRDRQGTPPAAISIGPHPQWRLRRSGAGLPRFQLYDAVASTRQTPGPRRGSWCGTMRYLTRRIVAIVTSHGRARGHLWRAGQRRALSPPFTLAATALGRSTIASRLAPMRPPWRNHFGLVQDRLIPCAISFGYAGRSSSINRFRTQRARPADIIDWKALTMRAPSSNALPTPLSLSYGQITSGKLTWPAEFSVLTRMPTIPKTTAAGGWRKRSP